MSQQRNCYTGITIGQTSKAVWFYGNKRAIKKLAMMEVKGKYRGNKGEVQGNGRGSTEEIKGKFRGKEGKYKGNEGEAQGK